MVSGIYTVHATLKKAMHEARKHGTEQFDIVKATEQWQSVKSHAYCVESATATFYHSQKDFSVAKQRSSPGGTVVVNVITSLTIDNNHK